MPWHTLCVGLETRDFLLFMEIKYTDCSDRLMAMYRLPINVFESFKLNNSVLKLFI